MSNDQAAGPALPFFLKMAQFCAHFSVGRTKAYALLNSGAITAKRFGRRTLITTESALRWAASLPDLKGKGGGQSDDTGEAP